ncbi:hypothetical protein F5Y12DRAFT_799648 [Xylaria sp. FL1777]|nr:hypothetical protein F5Y12DRAFT_799648 [Xylaria sp. FL1777]
MHRVEGDVLHSQRRVSRTSTPINHFQFQQNFPFRPNTNRSHEDEELWSSGNANFKDIVNLRDQIEYWSQRVQAAESAQASLEDRLEYLSGRDLKARVQGLHLTAKTVYELLIGRIEALETALKDKQSEGGQHSELVRITQNEANDIAVGVSSVGVTTPVTYSPSGTTAHTSFGLVKQPYKPVLTNESLMDLLRSIDFGDNSHLRLLCKLDSRDIPRAYAVSCDITIPDPYEINYVIQSGPGTSYIADHPACRPSILRNVEKLEAHGIQELRVLRLSYSVETEGYTPEEELDATRRLELWKRTARPPRYVYELGELVLAGIDHGQADNDYVPTKFNVVVDMVSPQKPVWLFMRPEFEPVKLGDPDNDQARKYLTLPSEGNNGDHMGDYADHSRIEIGACAAARIAKKIREIDLLEPAVGHSYVLIRYDGSEFGMKMLPDVEVRVQFVIPGYEEIVEGVGEGCSATMNSDNEE